MPIGHTASSAMRRLAGQSPRVPLTFTRKHGAPQAALN